MITPVLDRVLGNSRACLTCVMSSVLIPVYNCILAASGLSRGFQRGMIPLYIQGRECARVQGRQALLPVRHEDTQGAAVGGVKPPSSNHHRARLAEAERSPYRVRMHASCACNAHAHGRSTYLMITVPIDTILRINNLQFFCSKMQCHFVLF